jgi:hypothetical protein
MKKIFLVIGLLAWCFLLQANIFDNITNIFQPNYTKADLIGVWTIHDTKDGSFSQVEFTNDKFHVISANGQTLRVNYYFTYKVDKKSDKPRWIISINVPINGGYWARIAAFEWKTNNRIIWAGNNNEDDYNWDGYDWETLPKFIGKKKLN